MKNEEILKERAQRLAKPLKKRGAAEGDYVEILVFKLAHERYGIETKYAKEVQPLKDYTELPCTPPYIFGIVNLRRKILTVIDLKVLFGLNSNIESSKVVILQEGEKEFGILSEGLEGIQKISLSTIQPNLPSLTGFREEMLKGITQEGLVLLDGKKLLYSKQIVVNEAVD